ncbi:MAG TPA: type I methionyl aminopeptidase, partial [Cyclobacteriaceae bacterium]|nr:type I methionyl aminopeptidase [Cyclobacteriaceae bacterium]
AGVKTKQLDTRAEEYIRERGGKPSFLNYNGFPASLCISVNETVVHGFPGDYELKDGDIVTVDCGVEYKGFHSDAAYTYPLEGAGEEVLKLLDRTYESLYLGIGQAKAGNRIGDIGFAIQTYVESFGYGVVRELVGHGVGRKLHEDPEVPNYGKRGKGIKIVPGMVFAIEPMINMGTKNVVQEKDGWTIRTADRKPSAHFEHMVAVYKDRTEVLTSHEEIEKNYSYKWRNRSR